MIMEKEKREGAPKRGKKETIKRERNIEKKKGKGRQKRGKKDK